MHSNTRVRALAFQGTRLQHSADTYQGTCLQHSADTYQGTRLQHSADTYQGTRLQHSADTYQGTRLQHSADTYQGTRLQQTYRQLAHQFCSADPLAQITIRERIWENGGEGTGKVEINTRKKFVSVDEACKANLRSAPGFKGEPAHAATASEPVWPSGKA